MSDKPIGILGDITFESSNERVRVWQDATRSGSARWAKHDVFAGKPRQEFIGPDLTQIHLTVRLDINLGIVPRDELRKMRESRDTGEVLQFTIGGGLVGDFIIKDIGETWTRFDPDGTLTTAVMSLSLEEYV